MGRVNALPSLLPPAGWLFAAPLLAAPLLAAVLLDGPATAQDTTDYYRQNCMSCHTIGGGPRTGPDLKNVTERQDRPWLINFIEDPTEVLASGDPYAQKLFMKFRRVPMPKAPGMTRERAEKLLHLIETESKKEDSEFKGLQISTEPFTPDDVERGRRLFMGLESLENGGASCISCHGIHDATALGGGQLGPDLTNVFDRLGGRDALSAWLVAPSTATMQPIFKNNRLKPEEIHALVAYFKDASPHRPADPTGSRVMFLLLGLGGAVGMMFAFDAIWKHRLRSVRSSLVEAAKARGDS